MPTPKQDARAVLRLLERADRIEAQRRETETALKQHAMRLCNAHGYPVPLRDAALRNLAMGAA